MSRLGLRFETSTQGGQLAMEVGVAGTRGDDKPADSSRAGVPYAEEQGTLFDAGEQVEEVMADADGAGYRGPTACNAAGITYRQLDYWARTGLVEPSVRGAHGSGSQRLYSFRDILVLNASPSPARLYLSVEPPTHGAN